MHQSTYRSILVPLDGSPFSATALPAAAAFARRTGAALHLAIVHDPSTFMHFTPGDVSLPAFDQAVVDKQCNEARAWIEEQAASIANTGLVATGTQLEGTVVEVLAEHADTVGADLVIMTTHGRSGLDRIRLGSVATSFLARSNVPVFLVRPTGAYAPAAGREVPAGRMMVPLDGSPFGEAVLPTAMAFANALGLPVEFVTVVAASATDHAHTYLSGVATALASATALTPTLTVLSDASPARALVDYAATSHPGVIAMATHGRSGLMRLVLGSVANKVFRGVEQPLLVYRPDNGGASSEEPASTAA